ncbi:MAG TPA: SpoVG family protein [Gemmataceae bacterium]|nr:SpoVG family protein [Gemmataceae bacterium]
MVITEVRIKLVEENNERLMAFCSVTLDNAFVIRDLKIIEGTKGLFVAMPSRKLTDRCPRCGSKNHLRARYCNGCGHHLDENRAPRDHDGRAKLHADIAHPINSACREVMQMAIIKAYTDERERAKMPGYVCTYDDYDGGDVDYDTPSYAGMVAGRGAYKSHGGHQPVARGTHLGQDKGAAAKKSEEGFGAGL